MAVKPEPMRLRQKDQEFKSTGRMRLCQNGREGQRKGGREGERREGDRREGGREGGK